MAESIAFNIDCMEYLKTVPDKYFDLAVCDPPYGGGSSQTVNVERERERRTSVEPIRRAVRQVQASRSASTAGTDGTSTSTSRQGGRTQQPGRVELGRRSTEKNHCVGRCPGERVFRRNLSRLTQSDNLGRQLFRFATNALFPRMAQAHDKRELFNGYGRIRMDEL